jgi:hypothetical protein
MSQDISLRLYANPARQVIRLVCALGFTLFGLLMLRDPSLVGSKKVTAIAYVVILFFGFGTVVLLLALLRHVVLRHPVLQIDVHGWSYQPPFGRGPQRISWDNIAGIGVYHQLMTYSNDYWLVVHARDPRYEPRPRIRAFVSSIYPSLSSAVLTVPLNSIFLRTTPAKCEQLLRHICTAYGSEFQHYGVYVYDKMQHM